MKHSPAVASDWRSLREDALAIWRAAVAAVRSDELVRQNVRVEGHGLHLVEQSFDLRQIERIVVVGAGKAGAGMAAGFEAALGDELLEEKNVAGWVNVPADCVRPLRRICLHAARPAGRNEPTDEGVQGAERILELVRGLGPRDLCVVLLSGGGSALLPAPAPGIRLADKQLVTTFLSGAGANIAQLNTVRKQLSRIKGGRLSQACRAGNLVTLVISDVLGDPLDVISSGPTVPDTSTPSDALRILDEFGAWNAGIPDRVRDYLRTTEHAATSIEPGPQATNWIIGNNALAVDAAGIEAERRGYQHAMSAAVHLEGAAEDVGRHHARMAERMLAEPGPNCLITGGEPVVKLVEPSRRGLGGRNQQLVLAALETLDRADGPAQNLEGVVVLSGGTDGEDGPTDAAGAFIDADVAARARAAGLAPGDFLARNDAYHFFDRAGGLIRTGPTHTNVCDVRVVLALAPRRP